MTPSNDDYPLPEQAKVYLGLMHRRYACKRFESTKKIPDALKDYIIECGRLAPSSFGLEHWHFIAWDNPGLKSPLVPACFNQEAVATASLFIAILVRKDASYHPDSSFIHDRSDRFPGGYAVFHADYDGYYQFLKNNDRLMAWARAQAYIPAITMATGAIAVGVDSLIIEGFNESSMLDILTASDTEWECPVCVAFGFKDDPERTKIREPVHSIMSQINPKSLFLDHPQI